MQQRRPKRYLLHPLKLSAYHGNLHQRKRLRIERSERSTARHEPRFTYLLGVAGYETMIAEIDTVLASAPSDQPAPAPEAAV
jgi:hypothetical protein